MSVAIQASVHFLLICYEDCRTLICRDRLWPKLLLRMHQNVQSSTLLNVTKTNHMMEYNGIMRYGKDVRVNVFNPGYIIHMSKVWSKSISIIRHCHVSFLQDGGKWNPQSWQGLTKSALVFLQYLEIYSLQCRDCLVSQFYWSIRLDLHLLSLPKLPNLQFTQIPNYQIWIMSCETFSVNIFL